MASLTAIFELDPAPLAPFVSRSASGVTQGMFATVELVQLSKGAASTIHEYAISALGFAGEKFGINVNNRSSRPGDPASRDREGFNHVCRS